MKTEKRGRGRPIKPIEQLPATFEELLEVVVQPVERPKRKCE